MSTCRRGSEEAELDLISSSPTQLRPCWGGGAPTRCKTPKLSRPPPTPIRTSIRQTRNPSMVPVNERATLRLDHGFGILGPREKMTERAAEGVVRRFDKTLCDTDIMAIAKLTNMDVKALKIVAGMCGTDGVAQETPSFT
ncbi:Histidyl-tRNA synthetase [Hordeum vulgare]|nr:Histidyl-tRNA synthetase [Hordeum vulgare]